MAREKRRVNAQRTKPRKREDILRKLVGPKPTDDKIGLEGPEARHEGRVDPRLDAVPPGLKPSTDTIETERIVTTNRRMDDLVTVTMEE